MKKPKQLSYIAVDGPIGAGKTTLVQMLAKDLGGQFILEPVEKNPFLPEFYKNKDKNAFKTQLFFLLNRFQQQKEIKALGEQLVVCDYTFAKDAIFANMNLSSEEQKLYNTIYELLHATLPQPDLVIYLKADANVMLERIKSRGYDYEKSIKASYLEKLTEAYNQHFLNYNDSPLLVVDSTAVNYQANPQDFAQLKREIANHRGGTAFLIARS